MKYYYTNERNAQILISLLKVHNIKRIIISPGTTNICFSYSVQQDEFFEVYSAPDERSAAYMACGMAAETGEAVVLSCTGATASRNYMPGLTEAYYRKLPVLVVTSSRRNCYIGHNMDQVTDRRVLPRDVANINVQCPVVHDEESEWNCTIAANKAILELRRNGGGPAHINLETNYSVDFSVKELPPVQAIYRVTYGEQGPQICAEKVVVRVGAHMEWDEKLVELVDLFCEKYNAIVVCDHTGNYKGKYGILANLLARQENYISVVKNVDLMIHIGDVAAPLYKIEAKTVWRVNLDGEIRDTYRKLEYVFEMTERAFFERYTDECEVCFGTSFYDECKKELELLYAAVEKLIPSIPFSNIWVASQTINKLPSNAVLHLGIHSSLRFWNLFELSKNIPGFCNTGGYGIDGNLSAVIGASLTNRNKLYFCVLGDLAFFYDMNSLGNRHLGNNLRVLLVNNGVGAEFKLSTHMAYMFDDKADTYIAASGHYGNKSSELVKHYAQDLGFEYLSASTKEEYLSVLDRFVVPEISDKPILLEVFTNSREEDLAFRMMLNVYAGGECDGAGEKNQAQVKEVKHVGEIERLKDVIRKDNVIINLYQRWMLAKSKGMDVARFIRDSQFEKVAVYGMGSLGVSLCDELEANGIEIAYVIEQDIKRHSSEYCFFTPEEKLPDADVIVITPITYYDEIIQKLSQKVNCALLSLDDIIP